jgi:hypothetical protein
MKKITIELTEELTEEQVEELLQQIKDAGILKKKKDVLKKGQEYWYLTKIEYSSHFFDNDFIDNDLIARDNFYLTEEEVIKADKKRLALGTIRAFIKENDLEFTPNWEDSEEVKYQITGWNYCDDKVIVDMLLSLDCSSHNLNFKSEEDRQKVLDNCTGELEFLLKN